MGTITTFPITTSTIPELDAYGSVNNATKATDLIEEAKNIGTVEAPIWVSVKSTIEEFKTRHNLGGEPRFFEKYDKYELVYSSMSVLSDGDYKSFDITPSMHGYYLQMHIVGADNGANENLLWGNNIAWDFNFTGTFPDGFCVRIQPLTLGGSKCNVSEFYLTSAKTYDFVYNSELDHWAIDEMNNICHPQCTYLPMYQGTGTSLILTNSNHTYIFKVLTSASASPTKNYILPPTSVWKGRKIEVLIDTNTFNNAAYGPFFYPTPYALLTGTNDYVGVFSPVISSYIKGQIVWGKVPTDSSGLVTLDAGAGAKKAYISGVQANTGDLLAENIGVGESGIYQFSYDPDLDSANGGWVVDKSIKQPDLIEGDSVWRFPYGISGCKKGSYIVFESEGFGSIKIVDMNIII